MIARNSHQVIYKMMLKIQESIVIHEGVKWGNIPASEKLVKITTYSDSIMIYSKDDSYNSLDYFICTVSGVIEDLLVEGIPFKGSVAFGTMTLDTEKSIFFGQPLIDAFLLQEELLFYGIVFHASAEEKYYSYKNHEEFTFTAKYKCPFKQGASEHLTIYPMNVCSATPTSNVKSFALRKAIRNLRFRTSGHLRVYIDNTEKFIVYIEENELL